MRHYFLAAAALLTVCVPAVHAKPVDWTGWYGGANAGYVQSDVQTKRSVSGAGYFNVTSGPAIEANSLFDLGNSGVTAGFQYGYNQKLGGIVLGGEADINYTDSSDAGTATAVYPCCGPSTFTTTAEFEQTWLATLRAKFGVPVGPALLYATGGIAFGEVEITQGFSDTSAPVSFATQSHSETLTGWTAGGGIEFPIDDGIALRTEYLYADLGDVSTGAAPFVPGFPNRLSETKADVTSQSIRIGINWHY